jgi:mxaJ protein
LRFEFGIAMGVRKEDAALRDELNRLLDRRREEINKILEEYRVPQVAEAAR